MRRYTPLFLLLLTGCSWTNDFDLKKSVEVFKPYKIDIQQGNAVTQEMVAKLKPGMTPAQVRFALGTPLVVDPFRINRWDYVYRMEKAGQLMETRRITVVFEDDKLKGIEGDVSALPERPKPESAKPAEAAPAQATQPAEKP